MDKKSVSYLDSLDDQPISSTIGRNHELTYNNTESFSVDRDALNILSSENRDSSYELTENSQSGDIMESDGKDKLNILLQKNNKTDCVFHTCRLQQ